MLRCFRIGRVTLALTSRQIGLGMRVKFSIPAIVILLLLLGGCSRGDIEQHPGETYSVRPLGPEQPANEATTAQPQNDALRDEILAMDAMLFEAFNNRDLETMKQLFDPDLEFYHDTGGVSDYRQSVENSRRLFEADTGLTRELLIEYARVYPVPDYGAIQVGKHRFCHPENGEMDCGVFEFLHIWKKNDSGWTVARVVSYAH